MAYHSTILRQIIDIFPRHEFESLAKRNVKSCQEKIREEERINL